MSTEEKWYEKYVGLPFVMFGESPEKGIDCFNLIRHVYQQELNINIPYVTTDFCNILDNQWYNKTQERWIDGAATLDYGWEKIDEPDIFSVITMTIGSTNCTNHCALYVETDRILQTMDDHVSWVAPYGRYYQQYTIGIYKWNPLHMKI